MITNDESSHRKQYLDGLRQSDPQYHVFNLIFVEHLLVMLWLVLSLDECLGLLGLVIDLWLYRLHRGMRFCKQGGSLS